jgi:uncharacterized protein (TIGR02996 family)
MTGPDDATFLRAVGAAGDDSLPRLVHADWLDEHGQSARAEFIRTQCALAAADLPADRRRVLELRERELLDEHRQAWIDALGFAVEDVEFARGYPERLRLSKWPACGFFESPAAAHLATLSELDLSDLECKDEGLADFVSTAKLPRLRKLILSGNGITDAGAAVLATATGLPALDSLFLFQNAVTDLGVNALECSEAFTLAVLDNGDLPPGYSWTPGETEVARRRFLNMYLLRLVRRYFNKYPLLRSAALCVGQFWMEEAGDAVHGRLVVSERPEPTLDITHDSSPDPNIPNTPFTVDGAERGSFRGLHEMGVPWSENCSAIPLWAAFALEGGRLEYERIDEVYAAAVLFHRHGGYTLRPMTRQHLDGYRWQWELVERPPWEFT